MRRYGLDLSGSGQVKAAGVYECGNEPSDCAECGNFFSSFPERTLPHAVSQSVSQSVS
jgi:hypothetical protein